MLVVLMLCCAMAQVPEAKAPPEAPDAAEQLDDLADRVAALAAHVESLTDEVALGMPAESADDYAAPANTCNPDEDTEILDTGLPPHEDLDHGREDEQPDGGRQTEI